MPIYEFYCEDCNTIFSFFSRTVNTDKQPPCPRCTKQLQKQMSVFAFTGKAREEGGMENLPMDEGAMEKAMQMLSTEAAGLNENDPRQAANLMRRLSEMTGVKLGEGINEALRRMEAGEDPDQIESEMGDLLQSEDPFEHPGAAASGGKVKKPAPKRDETLYDL
jgi:putative FmdB family regulatory protein